MKILFKILIVAVLLLCVSLLSFPLLWSNDKLKNNIANDQMTLAVSRSMKSRVILITVDGYPTTNTVNWIKDEKIKVTFFISAPYFITQNEIEKIGYYPPQMPKNHTYLKWRNDNSYISNTIRNRIRCCSDVIKIGSEIGCHGIGHFWGSKWTKKDWDMEFETFKKIMDSRIDVFNLQKSNYMFGSKYIKGFRAPNLSVNSFMYESLKDNGFVYDTSLIISHGIYNFLGNLEGLHEIAFHMIKDHTGRANLPIDYNFYLIYSNLHDVHVYELEKQIEEDYYQSLLNYISSDRFVMILNHGSDWNNFAYWMALKRFVSYAKRNYICEFMTCSEYVEKYLKVK